MDLKTVLRVARDWGETWVRRPAPSAKETALLPYRSAAADFARRWPKPDAGSALPRVTANGDNPIRAYFDSVTSGPGIWKWTHYFDVYHRHLQKFVGKPVSVVEVGVYSGGSLAMWLDYFGAGCELHGVDIQDACRVYANADKRLSIHIGDQGDREWWRRFRAQVPGADVLIDDGGHHPDQQIATLEEMLPHLRPGGVYICEDVARRFAAYAQSLGAALFEYHADENAAELASLATPFQQEIESVHLYPHIVVIEKRASPLQRLESVRHGTQWQPFPG